MKMNALLKNTLVGMDLTEINSELPSGKIQVAEGFLKSVIVPSTSDCFINGRFDFLSQLSDGTYSVIDFKISDPNEEKVQKFRNQLHAYKFALENPAEGEPKKISKMGLVIISPESIEFPKDDVVFKSKPKWFEINEDMDGFYNFISDISELLNGPIPETNPDCAWCKYRLCFNISENKQGEDINF